MQSKIRSKDKLKLFPQNLEYESPYSNFFQLNHQSDAKRRQFSQFSNKNYVKQNLNYQNANMEQNNYNISIPNNEIYVENQQKNQRSLSMQCPYQDVQDDLQTTNDKTYRDQDIEGSITGLIKFLENQGCFQYSNKVKSLLNENKKLQLENQKLRKRQLDVISFLSNDNSFQSPYREPSSQNQQTQAVLSSGANLVDDYYIDSIRKRDDSSNTCRKNLFQTELSMISPNQTNSDQATQSPGSFSYFNNSIEDKEKEILQQIQEINIKKQSCSAATQIKSTVINKQIQQINQRNNINNFKNSSKTSYINKKNQKQQQTKKQKTIKVDELSFQSSVNRNIQQVKQPLCNNQRSQSTNLNENFGRQTATFLDPACIQKTQDKQNIQKRSNSLRQPNNFERKMIDSLKIYKKILSKSKSPYRKSVNNNNAANTNQPRKQKI